VESVQYEIRQGRDGVVGESEKRVNGLCYAGVAWL
jgi:hypothetical protein